MIHQPGRKTIAKQNEKRVNIELQLRPKGARGKQFVNRFTCVY